MREVKQRCIYCKCEFPLMLTKDHKIPKSLGGTDDEKNMQVCCWTCNQLKGSLTHKEFLEYRKALLILLKLKKIRLEYPQQLLVKFLSNYYPGFKNSLVKTQEIVDEAKKKGDINESK